MYVLIDIAFFLRNSVYDVMPEVSCLLLTSIPVLAYPRSRRASFAIWRLAQNTIPKWAAFCLKYGWLCPGYIDEILVITFIVVWFFVTPARRRALFATAHTAWIG